MVPLSLSFKSHQVTVQQFIDQLNGKWNVEQNKREREDEMIVCYNWLLNTQK